MPPSLEDLTPPHDIAAEQALLGAMMISEDAVTDTVDIATTTDFYDARHGTIHQVITKLYAAGRPVDPVTVHDALIADGTLLRIGGANYLHTLAASVPVARNASHYATIVAKHATLRRLIKASSHITTEAFNAEGDVDTIVDNAQAEILAATPERNRDSQITLLDAYDDTITELDALAKRGGGIHGIASGYRDLDECTNGFSGGQFIIIAARPAVGKSTVALDIARHAAIENGQAVAFFSLEMDRSEIVTRLISAEAKVNISHLRSGILSDKEWDSIAAVRRRVQDSPLFIDDHPGLTPLELRAQARRLSHKHDLKLIIVDYIQLMTFVGSTETRQQEVANFSRAMKLLAKELRVPVIALSQLNRGSEQRTDKHPVLSDLRDSGALEQDSDIVLLLHRDDLYDKDSPRRGEADMAIAKHRGGMTKTIPLLFQGHFSRMIDMPS